MRASGVFWVILWSYWPALTGAAALLLLSVLFRQQRSVYPILLGIGITIIVVVLLITVLTASVAASLNI